MTGAGTPMGGGPTEGPRPMGGAPTGGVPPGDDRIWQGVERHLAQVERLVPEAPAWRPPAPSSAARTGRKRRLAGLGALGAVGAVAAAVILVATLALGPLGSRRGTAAPELPAAAWSRLRLRPVQTANLFGPDDSVTSMIAWRGGFVAAGTAAAHDVSGADVSAAIWWSADGHSWARSTLPDAHGASIKQLLVWGDRLLALGGPMFIPSCPAPCWPSPPQWLWSSSDGRTWQRIDTGATFANGPTSFNKPIINSIAAGANGLVAVGGTGIDSPSIWTSADGTSWRSVDLTRVMPHGELDDVTTFDGRFVAIGSVPERPISGPLGLVGAARRTVILTSTDGHDWTTTDVEPQPAHPLSGLLATASGLIATEPGCPANASCATSTPLYASSDGRSWRPLHGDDPQPEDAMASDAQRMLAIRADPGLVKAWTTSSGSGWQSVPVDGAFAGKLQPQPTISAMAVGSTGVVIAGFVATRTGATPHLWLATPIGPTARPTVSPPPIRSPSPSPSSSVGPSPSSTPTPSPSIAADRGSLDWQEADFPDRADTAVTSIVGWRGGFVAGGSVKASGSVAAALWSSADGSSWERIGQGTPGFAGAGILQLLATPTGLLALEEPPTPIVFCPPTHKDSL